MFDLFKKTLLLIMIPLFLWSCASPQQQAQDKYPQKPDDNPERKSGPAMLFYEAAETDADPNNVIVIPPDQNEKQTEP